MQNPNPFQTPSAGDPAPHSYDHFEIGPAFSDAWSAASENVMPVVLLTLLYLLSFIPGLMTIGILVPLFTYGYVKALIRVYDGEEPGSMWPGFSVFGIAFLGLVGIWLATALPQQMLGVLLTQVFGTDSAIPGLVSMPVGLVIGGAFVFAQYIVIDQDGSPMEALTTSWSHTKTQLGPAILLSALIGLVTGAGVILLGVGILFTLPLGMLLGIAAYRQLYPLEAPAAYDSPAGAGFDPYQS